MGYTYTSNGFTEDITEWFNGVFYNHTTYTSDTVSFASSFKEVQKEPKFVPGIFNIKPYSVSKFQTHTPPFDLTVSSERSDGYKRTIDVTGGGGVLVQHAGKLIVPLPSYTAEERLLMQKAYGKLSEAVWDVGVDLAELGETAGLLASLIGGPRKLAALGHDLLDLTKKLGSDTKIGDLKKSLDVVKRSGKDLPQEAANMWLLARYGVIPALLSVNDALALLKKQAEKANNAIRTKRKRRKLTISERTNATVYDPSSTTTEWKSQLECIVYYKRLIDQSFLDQVGLVPENVPSILWETTRLSFVWDWFLHIGDMLNAMKFNSSLIVLGYSTSAKHSLVKEITQYYAWVDMNAGIERLTALAPVFLTGNEFTRTTGNGPVPYPVFTGLEHMNLQRSIDAAALSLKPLCNLIRSRGR